MSISSSDFTKQALGGIPHRQEQRVADDFRTMRQAKAQVVQGTADSNTTGMGNNAQAAAQSVKIEPQEIEKVNQKMSQLNVHLSFEMSEGSNQNIVKVLDQTTGDVVRQIPTEEFLKMSERIDAIMSQLSEVKGSLVNSQA